MLTFNKFKTHGKKKTLFSMSSLFQFHDFCEKVKGFYVYYTEYIKDKDYL